MPMVNSSDDEKWAWLLDISQIQPGRSAILNNNKIVFYGIHYTAIFVIVASIISCSSVIISVCRSNPKKRANWDFSDRFPMYLAFCDFIWGIVNLSTDHIILVIRQTYPEKNIATIFAINVCFFFGYQQLMNAGLSIYTYLKVVRRISLNLGRWEWRLHASVISFLILNVSINAYLGALGNAGLWFMVDMNTSSGKILAVNVGTTATIHAILTLTAYRSIQKVISNQKRVVSVHIPSASLETDFSSDLSTELKKTGKEVSGENKVVFKGPLARPRYHSTATNCLTTFVYISLCLYIPLAVAAWSYFVFGFFGYIEPTTAFLIVILVNSGGWVNAWGYFHNRRLKQKLQEKRKNEMPTDS